MKCLALNTANYKTQNNANANKPQSNQLKSIHFAEKMHLEYIEEMKTTVCKRKKWINNKRRLDN